MRKWILFILVLSRLLLPVCSVAEESVFIRIDRDNPQAWKQELSNVRFLQEEGMSGSAQFSVEQFHALSSELREKSENVWIIDCRLESHGFINGIAVSWCSAENGANLGKSVEEIEAEEESLSALAGAAVTAYTTANDRPVEGTGYAVETWETERSLAEA